MDKLIGYAICKDCGNGTLNNAITEEFLLGDGGVECARCGSNHIDGELEVE